MTTLWMVEKYTGESTSWWSICGIFSSNEKAQNFIDKFVELYKTEGWEHSDLQISQIELDNEDYSLY